jgi:hypothetical protein
LRLSYNEGNHSITGEWGVEAAYVLTPRSWNRRGASALHDQRQQKRVRHGGAERNMPKLRGAIATPEVKAEWTRAYELYLRAPGDRYDKKHDRTERIGYVAEKLGLTRKQAKRRVRNYEAWQRNIKQGLVEP